MRALSQEQSEFFKKNGYLHISGLFAQEEIESFRKGCRLNKPGDSMCRPEFLNIMFSPRMSNIMKDLLGEKVVYPCLSLTRTNDRPKRFGSRFFHHDAASEDGNYSREYPIVNTGIYLQDHINYSGGLKVIPGSHKKPCITSSTITGAIKNIAGKLIKGDLRGVWAVLNLRRSINIPCKAGDLIIWSVRTHHSGHAVRLRRFSDISLPPIIENWIPSFLRLPDNPERNVMLSIFAAPSEYLEPYIQKQITKDYRKDHYLNNTCLDNEDVKSLAEKLGIIIRNDGHHFVSSS